MRLNPFAGCWSAERNRHAAELADRDKRLTAADELIGELVEQRDWFHARWIEAGHRDIESSTVAKCLGDQLETAQRTIAELEKIAGPLRDPALESSPIFSEITQEIPYPADNETTAHPTVKSLAAAFGGAR